MKTIAIDARELRTTTGRYIERLLHYLQEIDTTHRYIVLLKVEDFDDWNPNNPNFQKVATPYRPFSVGEQIGFLRQINGLNADLVHFGKTEQPVLYRGKTLTTIHDLTTMRFKNPSKNPVVFACKQYIYKFVVKRVARKSTRILAISQFVKKDVATFTGISPDKISVTLEAANPITDSLETIPELEQTPFVMYVGRPTPHKNLERLVEGFALVQKKRPDLTLVLAGKMDENYRRLQAWTEGQGIVGVLFTDFVSEGQLRWLYEHAEAYVFPSLSEGFGLPGLEAMAHGCPLISSNATCLPEIYGDAAHYFDPTSTEAMAAKINEVLSNRDLRNGLIAKGHEQVRKYSWQKTATQTLAVYNQVLFRP